jgi:hypothetical protein
MEATPFLLCASLKEKRQQDIGENPAALRSPNAENDFGEENEGGHRMVPDKSAPKIQLSVTFLPYK